MYRDVVNNVTIPFVSILVPVYKVPELFLRRCLESLISQTLENIEIIVVDDGSPDICGDVCDEYAEKDKRIIVVHKKNGGLSSARNAAFHHATGKYITFVDGDDYLDINACKVAYDIAEKEKAECVFWNYVYEYNVSSKPVYTFSEKKIIFCGKECKELQERVFDFNGEFAQVFTKLILRKVLVSNKIEHIEYLKQGAEGLVFNTLLFEKINKAVYIPDHLYHYSFNKNSITHSHDIKNYYLVLDCFNYIIKYLRTNRWSDSLRNKVYTRILYVICTTAISGFFNPYNPDGFKKKIKGMKRFMKEQLVIDALKYGDKKTIGMSRMIVLFLLKHNCWHTISFIAKIRRKQLIGK